MYEFIQEQLLLQRQKEIEKQALHAWKFVEIHTAEHAVTTIAPPVAPVQPAAVCCAACC